MSLDSTVSNGCVEQDDAETCGNEAEFFGGVVGAVIDVDGFGDAAFVDGGLEAVEKVLGVVGRIEGAVGDDAGGVVDEADEIGFEGFAGGIADVGAVKGVALPEVVGMGFGEGEAGLGAGGVCGGEEFEVVDVAAEGVGGDLTALEETTLDAGAVDFLDVVFFTVEAGADLLDDF